MSRFLYFATSRVLVLTSSSILKFFTEKMADKKDPIMIRKIYQLMGLIAPDEPSINVKITAEKDPLAFLHRENAKSTQGATGLFLIKSDSPIDEKKLLQQ